MDLFYGTTIKEQLKALEKDVRVWALKRYGYNYETKKIKIVNGKEEDVGNCMLLVAPPFIKDSRPFYDVNYEFLKSILIARGLFKSYITPNFLMPLDIISKANIKEYSKWIEKLVDIVQPKFIVVLGEDSILSFFKRKVILRDYHGQIIGKTPSGIDICLSYAPDYYINKAEYEDPSFKNFILDNDWTIISGRYKELIK